MDESEVADEQVRFSVVPSFNLFFHQQTDSFFFNHQNQT